MMAYNNIEKSTPKLCLPKVKKSPDFQNREVQFGQTLWQLAIAYSVKIDEIKGLNNLSDNGIYPGTKLWIKRGVVQPAAAHTETRAGDLTATSTITPVSTATIFRSAMTSTQVSTPFPTSRSTHNNTIIGVTIGIVVLALLGGALFTWLGSSRK